MIGKIHETAKEKRKRKLGFVDRFLEVLPEIHIRGYNYCGPNTKLEMRLTRNVPGINELDCACKDHDIAYAESTDLNSRCKVDKILILKAVRRIFANDSRFGERVVALFVSCLISMKLIVSKIEIFINRLRVRSEKRKTYKDTALHCVRFSCSCDTFRNNFFAYSHFFRITGLTSTSS